jgi:Family of unknown function (DUF6152)
MKIKRVTHLFVIFGLLAISAPMFAHHGTTAYDPQRKVTMKGTVANFEWTNPHSQIHLDVTDDQGKVVHWNFEAQPPNILIHAGWTRETLKPGDQLTVVVNPAKNGSPIGIIQKIVLANGQELTMTEK